MLKAGPFALEASTFPKPRPSEGHWDTSAKDVSALFIGWILHAMPRERRNGTKGAATA